MTVAGSPTAAADGNRKVVEPPATPTEKRAVDMVSGGRKLKLLVADDDPDSLDLVAYRMERGGFQVVQARDGQEAIDLVHSERPDLAVIDVRMPKVDGYEVTRRIKSDPTTSSIRVILLTSNSQEPDVLKGFAAGADDYMIKPFSPEELRMPAGPRVSSLIPRSTPVTRAHSEAPTGMRPRIHKAGKPDLRPSAGPTAGRRSAPIRSRRAGRLERSRRRARRSPAAGNLVPPAHRL
jgi:DNA-binding response OmpR family regulator